MGCRVVIGYTSETGCKRCFGLRSSVHHHHGPTARRDTCGSGCHEEISTVLIPTCSGIQPVLGAGCSVSSPPDDDGTYRAFARNVKKALLGAEGYFACGLCFFRGTQLVQTSSVLLFSVWVQLLKHAVPLDTY
jgi:hypothetical protein